MRPLICGKRNAIIPIWFNSMKTNFTWTAKKIPKNPKYIGIRMAQNPQNQRPALGKSHNQLLKETIGFHIHFEVFSWTFPQFSRRGFCRLSPLNLGIAILSYWKRKKMSLFPYLWMNVKRTIKLIINTPIKYGQTTIYIITSH